MVVLQYGKLLLSSNIMMAFIFSYTSVIFKNKKSYMSVISAMHLLGITTTMFCFQNECFVMYIKSSQHLEVPVLT